MKKQMKTAESLSFDKRAILNQKSSRNLAKTVKSTRAISNSYKPTSDNSKAVVAQEGVFDFLNMKEETVSKP